METKNKLERYQANWLDEQNSAALYSALVEIEPQTQLKSVYRRMAEAELRHARIWEDKIKATGEPLPPKRLTWRTRTLIWLGRRFGTQFILSSVSNMEHIGSGSYDVQPEARAANLPQQERSHARLLQAITRTVHGQGLEGTQIARMEGRHRGTSGNALRAAVLGANDGLVSNLSLVMGVAGAELAGKAILITGMAGLLAGACSMALGEWLSVQSARELYERQIAVEQQEINDAPEEEAKELALIYEAKGLPQAEAHELATKMMQNQTTALDTLSREELGIDPDELGGSAWAAATTSFFLFAIGAIIPVSPFFFLTGLTAIIVSVIISTLALFMIGAGITLLTGRSVLFSGGRQVIFGLAAAAVTFGIGRLIGVAIG